MPPPRKRRRPFIAPPSPDQNETTPPHPPPPPEPEEEEREPALPADLLPEIAARSDVTTLVRFAACCKSLRREILRPAFIRRACRDPSAAAVVPPCVLGFSAAHPATPGVASFFERRLAPFAARTAGASLFGDYEPLTSSRDGLVVLRRRYLGDGDQSSDMCVYDPMSGDRTFLPSPPDFKIWERGASEYSVSYTYVLLTAAADGIGSSFLVLAAAFNRLGRDTDNLMVQTVSDAVVLRGYIHWLMYDFLGPVRFRILTDVGTATAGSIELPKEKDALPFNCDRILLGSSPDGRLSLHVSKKLKISVWLRRPAAGGDGDGWSRHAVIDIARAARSLTPPGMPYYWCIKDAVDFASSGVRSGAVLVRPFNAYFTERMMEEGCEEVLAVLDMETKELRRVNKRKNITLFPYEVDLEARLLAMKTFV
ncbi:hypothetical protein HU200_044182 [Digitaria exilis]|uniref:DUF7595 domain-containing protein n=1 Tax=Digitaria exilis TaxID=1010633 RepID=A0A835B9Q1_9POAL|nr:hypothetical protein HU200_044182 [Digitaria exilis]